MALGHGSRAREFEAPVAKVHEQIDADRELIRQHEVAIAEAEAEKVEAAAFEAGGGEPEEGQRRFDEAEQKSARHAMLIAQRRRVIQKREEDVAQLEREAEVAAYVEVYAELEAACEQAGKLSGTIGRKLSELLKVVPELVAARERVDELAAAARELQPTDVEFELPGNSDEQPYPGDRAALKELIELLKGGPRQLLADAELAAEKQQREQAQSDGRLIDQAVREALARGRFDRCEALSPELRLEAVRKAEVMAPNLPIEESGRATDAVRARVDRLRQLAAEVV
jgi:hypothetical protein